MNNNDAKKIKIGQTQRLEVEKLVEFGAYLLAGEMEPILLPKRYMPDDLEPGDELDCFVYYDSEDRLIATTEQPYAAVGECAYLEVVAINRVGAFVNWGLSKDLLVPYGEQAQPMRVGQSYVVYVYVDDASERIVGSTRLHRHLAERNPYFKPDQAAQLMIIGESDLGFKAVVEGATLGLIHHSDAIEALQPGQCITGYIKPSRADGKIDLALRPSQTVPREALEEMILTYLYANGGRSQLTDKSSPSDIYQMYRTSKANYKKAIGKLYKAQKIIIKPDYIALAEER